MGLPKALIKKYGISKKAWAVYRGTHALKKHIKKGASYTGMASKKGKGRRGSSGVMSMYGKLERGVGSARIAERAMNIVGFPQDPLKSIASTGIGFARGGVIGGAGALLFSSNILEMFLGGGTKTTSGEVL